MFILGNKYQVSKYNYYPHTAAVRRLTGPTGPESQDGRSPDSNTGTNLIVCLNSNFIEFYWLFIEFRFNFILVQFRFTDL